MKYRTLGSSGIAVSEIGFGAWGIGGAPEGDPAYGSTSDQTSLRALAQALEHGVTFFDTAPAYGNGHSETLVGQALKGRRGDAVVATKGGIARFDSEPDFSPAALERGLDQSLKRLQSDYVDVYQLHSPPPSLLENPGPLPELFSRWITDGRVRTIGISVKSPDHAGMALKHFPASCLQVNFNLVDQRCLELETFSAAADGRVSVIARTPLCFGFLTGLYADGEALAENDHRRLWSAEQRRRWAGAREAFRAIIARYPESSPAQFALRFCLSYPAVASTIPGMLSDEHVRDNAAAADAGPLAAADVSAIEGIYRDNEFFVGNG